MYDELAKKIRHCATDPMHCLSCGEDKDGRCFKRIMMQAADAIEELSKPRWISVTERLPEAESGDASAQVLVTDGECEALAEWFNFEMCEPYWSYTGIGEITHWMPLPEPPKEET